MASNTHNVDRAIRWNRRLGVVTLVAVAALVLASLLTGDHLSASTWATVVLLSVIGVLELTSARFLRLDRDDPDGVEGRSRRLENGVVMVGLGVPMVAVVVVIVVAVITVVR